MSKPLSTTYLRTQAARCQRLSRLCMDLAIARDLRLMADEYLAEAARMEKESHNWQRGQSGNDNEEMHTQNSSNGAQASQQAQHRTGPK